MLISVSIALLEVDTMTLKDPSDTNMRIQPVPFARKEIYTENVSITSIIPGNSRVGLLGRVLDRGV